MEELWAHRYRPLRALGAGALGTAWLVDDLAHSPPTEVCLKLLARADATNLAALRGEFELLRGLVHPHLVRVHDFGVARTADGERPFFTSDLIEGVELTRAPAEVARAALAGVLEALGFLHAVGIRHGDVKPENILVDERGHAVLLDLSCARAIANAADFSTPIEPAGTPAFMAPEVLATGRGDARADLFSFGKTLERLGGDVIATKHVKRLVKRLVAARPDDRPASVAEVLEALGHSGAQAKSFVEPARLLGRKEERALFATTLEALFTRAEAPRALAFEGPTGAGKSRLTRELVWSAELRGANVVQAFHEAEQPISELIERATGAALARPVPAHAALEVRGQLAARATPTVLFVDDADALDGPERRLLEALLRSLEPLDPISVVLSLSKAEPSFPRVTRCALAPLAEPDVRAWLASAGFEHAAERVLEATRGHPGDVARSLRGLASGTPATELRRLLAMRSSGSLPPEVRAELAPEAEVVLALVAASEVPLSRDVLARTVGRVARELGFRRRAQVDLGERWTALARQEASLLNLSLVTRDATGAALSAAVPSATIFEALGPRVECAAYRALAADLADASDTSSRARRVLYLAKSGDGAQAEREFLAEEFASRERAPRAWLRTLPGDPRATRRRARRAEPSGRARSRTHDAARRRATRRDRDVHVARARGLGAGSRSARRGARRARGRARRPRAHRGRGRSRVARGRSARARAFDQRATPRRATSREAR
ncbi:MAG: protein kinase [Polyangiaceae bacterium]